MISRTWFSLSFTWFLFEMLLKIGHFFRAFRDPFRNVRKQFTVALSLDFGESPSIGYFFLVRQFVVKWFDWTLAEIWMAALVKKKYVFDDFSIDVSTICDGRESGRRNVPSTSLFPAFFSNCSTEISQPWSQVERSCLRDIPLENG